MAESTDTSNESLENASNTGSEKRLEDKVSPIVTKNVTPKQEPQNMETHAHHLHHAPRKKFWHYFYEFLMLFLAVFCGFLAENQREHMVEHKREKIYMTSLLEDLLNDTSELTGDIDKWERMIRKADSLRNALLQQSEARDNKLIYRLASDLNYGNDFAYHDRTIGQLKYAGNFRLIRNKNIADSLVEYDAAIQTALKNIEEIYKNIIRPKELDLKDQLLNSKFYEISNNPILFDSAIKKEPDVILIKKGKEDIVFQYYNRLYNWWRLNRNRVNWQKTLLRKAINLIEMIRKEYHLK